MRKAAIALFGLLLTSFAACNRDGVIEADASPAPVIALDSETGVYSVKAGRELTISPRYEYADDARFSWTVDGRVIGEEPSLVFRAETVGKVYVLLEVSTRYGTASEELRVDVTALEVPTVSIPGAEEGFTILTDSDLVLKPSVAQVSIPVSYSWSADGREVSTERDYTFRSAEAGTYALRFAASNEDGRIPSSFPCGSLRPKTCRSAGRSSGPSTMSPQAAPSASCRSTW